MEAAEWEEWNITQAADHAVAHAPLLYMHPAEEYLLTDPRTYYQQAHLYNRYYQKLNKTAVMANAGTHKLHTSRH